MKKMLYFWRFLRYEKSLEILRSVLKAELQIAQDKNVEINLPDVPFFEEKKKEEELLISDEVDKEEVMA